MRVLVVGGGIGGLTAALALARCGMRPVLLEREAEWSEAGAGVQLGPNAVRALDDLGLAAPLRAAAFQPVAAELRSAVDGALRLHVPLGEAAQTRWGAPYLQIHRADLQRLLRDAVIARDAAEIRMGFDVESAAADGSVRFAGGAQLQSDALIGADGVRSKIREAVAGSAPARFTRQVAWRALIPPEALDGVAALDGAGVWTGRGRHVVAYRVRGGAAVNLVAIVGERRWRVESWREPADPRALAKLFEGWPEPVRTLAAAPAALGLPTWRWALFDRPPSRRWSRGRAALLGDAAHPMLPFLAQGAAMAIEDAVVLARTLAQAGSSPTSVEDALRRYGGERAPRVARVQAWSRRNARLFHLPEPLARVVFGAAAAIDARSPAGAMARFDWLYGHRA